MAGFASLVALAGMLAGAAYANAAPTFQHYVALGDSYASGPLIPNQSLHPIGCARSDHNYAGDLARSMHIPTLVDVSCGGATTVDMTHTQSVPLGSNAPEFNALTTTTDLVTVTIGGNDIGFTSVIETCALESLTNPFGAPCKQHFTGGGTDQLAARIAAAAPKVGAVLSGIRQRAPHAR
ncbi:MAG TPA: GDSL-type esterase/lipase family protein, partial [Pseudonocardiaceae bacterium]|nr:GDSL-type esterase/lipase family protein [Pseudonocardiaceae bacterium]